MRKSHSDLQNDVLDELAFDPSVDERYIGIAVHDGAVTLAGTVPSFTQKIVAETSVKRLGGVLGIVEESPIDLPAPHRRDDADLNDGRAVIRVRNLQRSRSPLRRRHGGRLDGA